MSKVIQERGFGSLPSSTETNPRDQVKLISTTDGADLHSIRRIGRTQYAISTRQDSNVLYKSRQTMIPFLSRLEYHYCEDNEESYGLKFTIAYGVSPIKDTIPQKEKDLGSFTLPCFINDNCFDNALVDLGASGDDEVTYQMVRSHPRFINLTNEQCNKIPPLLRVSEEDEKNGISHAYQKLKRFYKGVLNLGPDYIRHAKMEEWLTRGHMSVHEME
ncbi:hypothetical protein Tco_0760073 [Tanacetum coccineum]